jgi:capsular polysaccharide biosynthesis protein
VFVSYIGYCLDETGLIKECHHGYAHQYQDYLNDAGRYFRHAQEDENKLIYLEDEHEYIVIHHPWANYYHWITEAIPRLWLLKDRLKDLILIFPEDFRRNRYVTESLAPFSFKGIYYLPVEKNLFVKSLCLPQLKPISECYDPRVVREQRDFYVHYVTNKLKMDFGVGKRIYVSRKLASKRRIQNEEDVEAVMRNHNFTIIHCEQYSFFQQVSLFAQADTFVSIHGAGLTNMLFMPEGSTIVELHKRMTNATDQHSLVYWRLASALGHSYYHQICEPVDTEADFFLADFIVDINMLEATIKTIIKEK